MLTLNDGRNELWQWDTGRKLTVDADCSQVHFSNKVFGRSIDVDVVDGVAIIPDVLLQTDKELTAWAFVGTAENGYTKISKAFKVNRRNKPADYVFTPTEQTNLEEIKKKIDYLESIQDPDAIKDAVNDYLEHNPVKAPVQSVNGKIGAVNLTAEDIGAISKDDLQGATNEALAQAKESGEFDGKDGIDGVDGKDGYTPVKGVDYFTPEEVQEIAEQAAGMVEVPEGGGIDVAGAKVGQTIKVAEVDDSGRPLAWEPADVASDWDFINGITLQEDSAETIINCDSNGNPFGYRALRAYVLSKNASSQGVTFVPIGSTGHTLWRTGEACKADLGNGTGCSVTHEVMGERRVRNSISILSATHKEGWSYKVNGIHTQEEAYKYLTGYMISGTLAAGSMIEVYGYGKVTE